MEQMNSFSDSKFGRIKKVEIVNCLYDQIGPTIVALTSVFSIDAIVALNLDVKHLLLFTGATYVVGFLKDFGKYIGSNSRKQFLKKD